MMGPEKLGTIRAQVRKSFKMSDAELFAWFNQQIEDAGRKPKGNQTEIDTLRLLRDALVKETKRQAPRRKSRGVAGNPKK
jgi:hypothetical protein